VTDQPAARAQSQYKMGCTGTMKSLPPAITSTSNSIPMCREFYFSDWGMYSGIGHGHAEGPGRPAPRGLSGRTGLTRCHDRSQIYGNLRARVAGIADHGSAFPSCLAACLSQSSLPTASASYYYLVIVILMIAWLCWGRLIVCCLSLCLVLCDAVAVFGCGFA
jgi:hypothetical protein